MNRAWLKALYEQWVAARGRRPAPSARAFRRDWESLLASAGLHSAEDQKAAVRDAETEESRGHIRLHRQKGRKNIVRTIELPAAGETWLLQLFNHTPPAESLSASLVEIARAERLVHSRYPELWSGWCQSVRAAFEAGKSRRPLDWRSPENVSFLIDLTYALTSKEWPEGALVREVSVAVGLKPKDLERRRRLVEACLRQMFGRSMPLESLGIVLTDSRADIGGVLTLHYANGERQVLDRLQELYSISLGDLERAQYATTPALRLLTVENSKTTLRRLMSVNADSTTLLAGCSFPTKALIRLLELLPRDMPVFHFGDTDPAGYHILLKLREGSRRAIRPFLMARRPGKSRLTEYDRGLLPRLLRDAHLGDVRPELKAMMKSDQKGDYEQETLGLPDLESWPFFRRALSEF